MDTIQKPVTLLRLPAVLARVGLTKSPLYAAIKVGNFPAPVQISNNAVAWIESEIDSWIASKISSRDEVAA